MPLPIDATDTKINEELKNHFLFFETFDVSYQVYMLQGHIITSRSMILSTTITSKINLVENWKGECQYRHHK